MPFRFPLAAVLLVRENEEKREERALKRIQLAIANATRQVEELTAIIAKAQDAREKAMQEPISAFELQEHLVQSKGASEQKKIVLEQLQILRQELERQMKAYQVARRDREALTEMLQKQREAYDQEQAREQQKRIDDMFMARRHRS